MKVEDKIRSYVEEAIEGSDIFIVELKVLPKNRILILLDGDNGIRIDQCVKVSRFVSGKMEEDNLIESEHTLDVSSPGVDHPLQSVRQYPQHIGRTLGIRFNDGKEIEGTLVSVEGDEINLEAKIKEKGKKPYNEERKILLSEIKEAKIKITFK